MQFPGRGALADAPRGEEGGDEYAELLALADERTFKVPSSSDSDGDDDAGRGAGLAEGERLLARAVALRPRDMLPRVMLLRNLMLQDRGREAEVPALALAALRELAPLGEEIAFSPAMVPAMQVVLLALKALWKAGQEGEIPAFVASANREVPALGPDFTHLAERLDGQLCCGAASDVACDVSGGAGRDELLGSHRWLSCIDLQAVDGRHHKGSPGFESEDAF